MKIRKYNVRLGYNGGKPERDKQNSGNYNSDNEKNNNYNNNNNNNNRNNNIKKDNNKDKWGGGDRGIRL